MSDRRWRQRLLLLPFLLRFNWSVAAEDANCRDYKHMNYIFNLKIYKYARKCKINTIYLCKLRTRFIRNLELSVSRPGEVLESLLTERDLLLQMCLNPKCLFLIIYLLFYDGGSLNPPYATPPSVSCFDTWFMTTVVFISCKSFYKTELFDVELFCHA